MLKLSLLKKEIYEYIKTPKLLILGAAFIFFATSSPLLAKYMNEILASVASDLDITFPDPTLNDAWVQFFKNMHTIAMIIYLIVMTGTVAHEKSKGSIALVLSKNVSRFEFLLGKFISGALVMTVLTLISIILSSYYTHSLFGDYLYDGFIQSMILFWLMGLFYTSLGLLMSVISKTPTSAALFGFLAFAILQIANISSDLAPFNPAGSTTIANEILANTYDLSTIWIPNVVTGLSTIILFLLSYVIFKRQEI
jgi:ABC-type transport system involved in multi-copper enzyme maturation permease subunit